MANKRHTAEQVIAKLREAEVFLSKGTTPAVAAGIADRAYTIDDLVEMLEDEERELARGGRINRADRT